MVRRNSLSGCGYSRADLKKAYQKGGVDVIDKIVNELEKEIQLYEDSMTVMQQTDRDIEYRGAMRGLGKAIDILKNEAFVIKGASKHNGNSN